MHGYLPGLGKQGTFASPSSSCLLDACWAEAMLRPDPVLQATDDQLGLVGLRSAVPHEPAHARTPPVYMGSVRAHTTHRQWATCGVARSDLRCTSRCCVVALHQHCCCISSASPCGMHSSGAAAGACATRAVGGVPGCCTGPPDRACSLPITWMKWT